MAFGSTFRLELEDGTRRDLAFDRVEKSSNLRDNTFAALLYQVVATGKRRLLSVGRQLQPRRLAFLF